MSTCEAGSEKATATTLPLFLFETAVRAAASHIFRCPITLPHHALLLFHVRTSESEHCLSRLSSTSPGPESQICKTVMFA